MAAAEILPSCYAFALHVYDVAFSSLPRPSAFAARSCRYLFGTSYGVRADDTMKYAPLCSKYVFKGRHDTKQNSLVRSKSMCFKGPRISDR